MKTNNDFSLVQYQGAGWESLGIEAPPYSGDSICSDWGYVLVAGKHSMAFSGCDKFGKGAWLPHNNDFEWVPLSLDKNTVWSWCGETKTVNGVLMGKVYNSGQGEL